MILFAFTLYDSFRIEKYNLLEDDIIQLTSEIIYLNEETSLLVHLAAHTGDRQWIKRYEEVDQQLDSYINDLLKFSPENSLIYTLLEKTQVANNVTDKIEKQTLELLKKNKIAEAKKLIDNPTYNSHQAIVDHNTRTVLIELSENIKNKSSAHFKQGLLFSIILFITILVSFISWILTIIHIRKWKSELENAYTTLVKYEYELRQSNVNLEERVQARTSELNEIIIELKHAKKKLVQSETMSTIGQLSAGIAHEINNPLSFVISNVNTLNTRITIISELLVMYQSFMDEVKTHKSLQGSYEKIISFYQDKKIQPMLADFNDLMKESIEGLDRIKKIVFNLGSFSHVRNDSIQMTDINHCIELALEMAWDQLKYKCEIKKELTVLPNILVSENQIKIVIMSLLLNAAQSIEEKGVISISSKINNGMIEVKIADTGCGISKESLDKIFTPFFTTKLAEKAIGLGLSTAYAIIKSYNGDIVVKSEVNEGSEFTILFPIKIETDK